MEITLNTAEADIVEELLRRRLEDLRVEVRHTDQHQYHDELRQLEDTIRELIGKFTLARRGPGAQPR